MTMPRTAQAAASGGSALHPELGGIDLAASSKRPCAGVRVAAASGTVLALMCARNIHAAVDRRMPEASALATWLARSATGLGLPGGANGDDEESEGSRRPGVSAQDWRGIGSVLAAVAVLPAREVDAPADRWIAAIAGVLGLDDLTSRIFALALHYRLDRRVDRLFDAMSECRGGPTRLHRDADLIALLLGAPTAEVAARLANNAELLGSGLLQLERDGGLCVLERLVSLIRQGTLPMTDLYDQLLGAADMQVLAWEAFSHLGQEAEVAAAVLRAALSGREPGINILFYGPPGTGKTSFAATLAARIGARLRPVGEADESGDEPQRYERLAGLRLAQRLAVPGTTLLLFDEAEDLFVQRGAGLDEPATGSRVFMHRLLERMAVPVIWTANDISVLGAAVLRRMTMCLELRVPDLATRTALWRRMSDTEGAGLQDADAALLARLVPAAPAVASASLRATRLAGGGTETTRLIVEGVARAVAGGDLPPPVPERDAIYDPALVNADHDLDKLAADLLRPDAPRAVSFLLSGPPGTGKSAWVRHLAARMGLPVLQKRASDLLDPCVGETEQNIARAFSEARSTRAFLVFDEADSLLLDRGDAARSWEIAQVNEMLTWMESHALPFACTTNLIERLDRASLRRFLVKVRFTWLTAAQARLAFWRILGVEPPPGLETLRTLTPADFGLVRRRVALRPGDGDPVELVRLLVTECEGRVENRVPVGFVRSNVV